VGDKEILAKVRDIVADVNDLPNLTINLQTTAEDVDGWDSFNHINIVVAVEHEFGIKIHTAEIENLRNVGELVELIGAKLATSK
jgi:acyl carrier protein